METISVERVIPPPLQVKSRVFREASPTELVYISTGTTVVSRSSIAGAVSRKQFETAVARLEASYDILRSAVENGQFVQRVDDNSSVVSWQPSETATADAMLTKLLNAELDTSRGVYNIHVVTGDGGLDVFLLSCHAITDATSLIELHACLAYVCDCVVRNEVPLLEWQAFPSPIDAAVRAALNSLPEIQTVGGRTSYSGVFAEIPLRGKSDGRSLTHRLERIVINAQDTRQIVAASHAHGSSVHSLLLAAFALAIREAAPAKPRQALMRSNVDLRRRLEPHISTQLVFSAISARVTPITNLDLSLFEIAREIFEDIHVACADGSVFREYINYPTSFGSPQQAPVALSVSDMQNVIFRWPMRQLSVKGFEYALGWQKTFPNVSVSVYEGTLVANIVYVEEFIDLKVMRTISESFVKLLASASDGS
jgi:hypothetical protein